MKALLQYSLQFFPTIVLISATAYAQKPKLIVQTGHYDGVHSVAFSPDGKILASSSADGTIRLWEVHTGQELRTLTEYGPASNVAFSPDGKILANANSNYEIVLWQVATGKELHRLKGHHNHIMSLMFSPNGKILVSGSRDYKIKLWNVSTGQELRTLDGHIQGVYSVAFSPDGKILASSGHDETIKLWDVSSGRELHTLSADVGGFNYLYFNCVAFSPDGKYIAGGSDRSMIKLWEVANGKELRTLAKDNEEVDDIYSIAFSPNGKILASGGEDKTVHLWEVDNGKELRMLTGHDGAVSSVAFSPDGKILASGSSDATIKFWEVGTGKELRTITGYPNPVYSVAFSPDGQILASASNDTTIKLMELSPGQDIRLLTGHSSYVTCVVFSPDGKILASGSGDEHIKLWQVSTGRELRTLAGHFKLVNHVTFSPDGKILASSSHDQTIKLWEVDTGEELYTLTGDSSIVYSVAFSPDGKFLAGGIRGGKIRLWEVDTGRDFRTLPGHFEYYTSYTGTVAFSPDGKILASGSRDGEIKFWHVGTRRDKELRTLAGHARDVTFITFSPDGKILASGSLDDTVKLWDVDAGKELGTLAGHDEYITAVAFSPDGKILASGSGDTKIKLWEVASGKELASLMVPKEKVWVVVTPDGRFDGSPEGMKLMHYVQDNQVIPLEAFFEQFYTPKLLARVLSGEAETTAPPKVDLAKGIKLPPLVKITSPKAGETFTTDALNINVEATDQGGGVDEIRLYQNGKLVSEEQRNIKPAAMPGNKTTRTFPVTLVRGINELKAIAFNTDRTESNPDLIRLELRAAEPEARLYILVVGINAYKNASYNLNYGKPDAVAFVQALEKRGQGIFKQIFKQELYDEQATGERISAQFNAISAEAKPQDLFVFFYAGHGVMSEGNAQTPAEFYLVPHDVTKFYGDEGMLVRNGLSAKQLQEFCVKIKAQKQLVVLDACQAGGAVETFAIRGAAEEKAILQLARSAGVAVLAASGTKQFAMEFGQLGHGIFTYALLQGLAGEADGGASSDGKITVKELEAYLNDKVPELTQKYRGSPQYPNSYTRGQDFPLGVLR